MSRLAFFFVILCLHCGCQQTQEVSARQPQSTDAEAKPGVADSAQTQTPSTAPIHLPSRDKVQGKGYPIKGVRPAEVCMGKGFTWLFQGYLQPECGTCHYKDNRYGVTPFAQLNDEAASFAVLKTVTDTKKLMLAVLGNVFCKNCVIAKDDPLYTDLEYFTLHMDTCEKSSFE